LLSAETQPSRADVQARATHLLLRFFQQLQAGPAGPWLELNLTMPQLKMLFAIDWLGPVRMNQVAARLHIGVSAATGLIDRLVEQGLAQRESDPDDRRVVRVTSTDAGRSLVMRLRAAGGERLGAVLAHLSDDNLRCLASVMEQVYLAVEAEFEAESQTHSSAMGSRAEVGR
jgi:MarR family transcriptional regulator, organic hydroperoxide resistance regulator